MRRFDSKSKNNQKHLSNRLIVSLFVLVFLLFNAVHQPTESFAEGNNAQVHHTEWLLKNSITNHSNTFNLTLSNINGKYLRLERKENNIWKTVYKTKFNNEETGLQEISTEILSPTQKGIVNYRIIVNRTVIHSFNVNNHSPSDFSEYELKAYKTVEEYCGNVYITTGSILKMKKDKAMGLASTSENTIILRPGMSDEDLSWVVKHECGHILQHNAYDKNRSIYPLSEKRSILWLNEELSLFYDPVYENDRGTGYSEKNADCIAAYLDIENSVKFDTQCIGNKGQAAHNITTGKLALKNSIHKNFEKDVRLRFTGFAIDSPVCPAKNLCIQEFENGVVFWSIDKTGENLRFKPNSITDLAQEDYFYPKIGLIKAVNEYTG